MYMNLEKKMCHELEILEEKYRNGAEMSEGDLRKIDLLMHSLKSMAAYKAMRESEEVQSYNNGSSYMNNNGNSYMNNSYARGRGMDGRYISRDMGQDMSGHYPVNYPMYPEDRRW